MKDFKTLGTGLALGLLVAMALGQTKAPTPAGPGPRYQITAVSSGTQLADAVIYVLDNRTQAVSSCRQVDGKWQSASAFQLPE